MTTLLFHTIQKKYRAVLTYIPRIRILRSTEFDYSLSQPKAIFIKKPNEKERTIGTSFFHHRKSKVKGKGNGLKLHRLNPLLKETCFYLCLNKSIFISIYLLIFSTRKNHPVQTYHRDRVRSTIPVHPSTNKRTMQKWLPAISNVCHD